MIEILTQTAELIPLQIVVIVVSSVLFSALWLYRVILPSERKYTLDNTKFNQSVNEIVNCSSTVNEDGFVNRIKTNRQKNAG